MNTCLALNPPYVTIAYYSHLVPIALSLFLSIYSLIRTRYSKIALTFFAFTACFSLWLLGDLVLWTQGNYNLITAIWSWLDYINIVFFVLGAYFYGLLVKDSISKIEKAIFLGLCIPPFIFTLLGKTIVNFNQVVCEATNNNILTNYKFFAELVVVIMLIHFLFISFKVHDKQKKIQSIIVVVAILLFYGVFSSTEFIASMTGIYKINLYGLFILPVFLIMIVFSITNLGIFRFRLIGSNILIYTLIIMVGSQYIFLENSIYKILNLITLAIALFLGLLILQNGRREVEQREKIEKLAKDLETTNEKLKELDQLKSEFLSLATHQIRSPLTAIKGYSSMLMEGDYGVLPPPAKESVKVIMQSSQNLISIVADFLDISRIEQGRMHYDKEDFDLNAIAKEVIEEFRPNIEKARLSVNYTEYKGVCVVNADKGKTKQVIGNLIDNAIKYTPHGGIEIALTTDENRDIAKVAVNDSGVGIPKEEVNKLFAKFSRAKDANKTNVTGTGLGLYIAKKMMEAQGGTITVSSEGRDKGTTFTMEIPKAPLV